MGCPEVAYVQHGALSAFHISNPSVHRLAEKSSTYCRQSGRNTCFHLLMSRLCVLGNVTCNVMLRFSFSLVIYTFVPLGSGPFHLCPHARGFQMQRQLATRQNECQLANSCISNLRDANPPGL